MFSFITSGQKSPRRQTEGDDEEYELLMPDSTRFRYAKVYPSSIPTSCTCLGRRCLPSLKRVVGVLCMTFIFLCVLVVVYGGIPPSFSGIKAYESSLPQHDWSKHYVGGGGGGVKEQKYLSFPDHIWGHGFNNVLQEMYVPFSFFSEILDADFFFFQPSYFIPGLCYESYIRV